MSTMGSPHVVSPSGTPVPSTIQASFLSARKKLQSSSACSSESPAPISRKETEVFQTSTAAPPAATASSSAGISET